MGPWDAAIIVIYLVVVTAIGLWLARGQDSDNFFVNRQSRSTALTLFSVVSTNVGAATLLGVASEGFKTGISWGLNVVFIVVFGFLFLGLYANRLKKLSDDGKLTTLSQFYLLRYKSKGCHRVSSLLILAAYFLFISAQFRGLSQMISFWTGTSVATCIYVAGALVVALTALRGIKGDMYTDGVHFVVMFIALLLLLPYFTFHNHVTTAQIFQLPKEYFNPFNYQGEVFFLGSIAFGIPVLFASMEFWQLLFSLKDNTEHKTKARRLFFWAAVLNAPMILVPTVLGLSERALNPNLHTPDLTLIDLITTCLPAGARGLAAAGLLAAILSTVNAMVLVASSTFSFDILESGLSIKPPLLAKRLITAVVGVLGVLLATRMGGIVDQLILGCQVIGILAPSLVGGMWLGERFKSAAFYSLIVGVVSFPIALAIPALGMKLAFVPAITLSTFTYLCVLAFKTRKLPN